MSTQVVVEELLKRKKFEPATVSEFGNAELLQQAQQVLGYAPRAVNERVAALARGKEELAVAEALEKLGVEPLDPLTVARYKQAKVSRAKSHESCAFVRYMHKSHSHDLKYGERVAVLSFIGLVVGGLTTLGISLAPHSFAFYRTLPTIGVWYWALFLPAYLTCMYARHKHATSITAEWKGERLQQYYTAPVPDFAISRAIAVKTELPTANFYVESLMVKSDTVEMEKRVYDPDPFLVMEYGSTPVRVYLDVWDEPKFEARRVA